MEESLNSSNKIMSYSSLTIFLALQEKIDDPMTRYKAEIWYPKAEHIQNLSKNCYDYIESLKKESGLSAEKSTGLLKKLKSYKAEVLNVDSFIKKEFTDAILISEFADSTNISEESFFDMFFKTTSKESTNAFLTKLQNNVKRLENRTMAFCNDHIMVHRPFYDLYNVIIEQNSQIVGKSKEIKITAGVGSFSKMANAKITINNEIIPLNENGVSLYKIKAPNKSGKYKLPVRIQFIDENGKTQIIEKNVEYSVAKECDQ